MRRKPRPVLIALVVVAFVAAGTFGYMGYKKWRSHDAAPAAQSPASMMTTTTETTTATTSVPPAPPPLPPRPTAKAPLSPELKRQLDAPPLGSSAPKPAGKTAPKVQHVHVSPTRQHGTTGEFLWKHWGGAPYASSAEESEKSAKLNPALDMFVAQGMMPREVADLFAKAVAEHPEGLTDPPGQHPFITPGMRFTGMLMDGRHPYLAHNVLVSKHIIGKGQVKAIEAFVWGVTYNGVTYQLWDPFVCGNWALIASGKPPPPPPPPPAQAECYVERVVVVSSNGDTENHFGFFGSRPQGPCAKYRILHADGSVLQDWQSYETCPDLSSCTYDAVKNFVNGMPLAFKGSVRVPPECTGSGCIIEKGMSPDWALSRSTMILECLIRGTQQGSCGVMVRQDDYHAGVAKIFYGRSQFAKVEWGAWRKLYWIFVSNMSDCPLAYQP